MCLKKPRHNANLKTFGSPPGLLSIYLKNQLGYDEDIATVIYHTFSLFATLTPLIGGFISDQYLGKYR